MLRSRQGAKAHRGIREYRSLATRQSSGAARHPAPFSSGVKSFAQSPLGFRTGQRLAVDVNDLQHGLPNTLPDFSEVLILDRCGW